MITDSSSEIEHLKTFSLKSSSGSCQGNLQAFPDPNNSVDQRFQPPGILEIPGRLFLAVVTSRAVVKSN